MLSCPVLSCSVLSCPVLCCPVLCCPMLSCPVLSCPVLSCPVLSYVVLSCSYSADSSSNVNTLRDASRKLEKMRTYSWLRRALQSSHQKYHLKNQEAFLGEADIYKTQSTNLHVCSALFNTKCKPSALRERSALRSDRSAAVTLALQQKHCDLYRPATGSVEVQKTQTSGRSIS